MDHYLHKCDYPINNIIQNVYLYFIKSKEVVGMFTDIDGLSRHVDGLSRDVGSLFKDTDGLSNSISFKSFVSIQHINSLTHSIELFNGVLSFT